MNDPTKISADMLPLHGIVHGSTSEVYMIPDSPPAENMSEETATDSKQSAADLTETAEMPGKGAVEQPKVFYVPDSDEEAEDDESHVPKMCVLMMAKNAI